MDEEVSVLRIGRSMKGSHTYEQHLLVWICSFICSTHLKCLMFARETLQYFQDSNVKQAGPHQGDYP